ncbi:MAG: hypothetical protein NTX48_16850 [Planctomycetales bacterium]|nr:hypothetical protein [Planctomycetales bacterium]
MNPYDPPTTPPEPPEPSDPRRQATVGSSRLFWLLMVIVGGLTLSLIVFAVLVLLVAGWMLSG